MSPRPFGVVTVSLLEAIQRGHRYGADIMDVTGRGGGTVYKVLRRLERRGLIVGAWEEAEIAERDRRPRRRYYMLSKAGEQALEAADARRAGTATGSAVESSSGLTHEV